MARETVCPDMPPAYAREVQCGAETMPTLPHNWFVKPKEEGEGWWVPAAEIGR